MGKIADRYRRRVAAVGRETARLRGDTAKLLKVGLQEATQQQLYDRSKLKVSRKMFNSIAVAMEGNNAVSVGYQTFKAPYVGRRLNLKGTSKSGGHLLDMQPNEYLRRVTDPKIRRLALIAKRRMMEQ